VLKLTFSDLLDAIFSMLLFLSNL